MDTDDKKADANSRESDTESTIERLLVESPGVLRIEAISSAFDFPLKVTLFVGIFLLSYAYGLGMSSCRAVPISKISIP